MTGTVLAEAAVADIRAASGSTLLRACARDLASLAQVRSLADGITDSEPRLDVLVNNVTGRHFDRLEEARARPQAYDPDAREQLGELSERLVGLAAAR